jgi:hypothetical protein
VRSVRARPSAHAAAFDDQHARNPDGTSRDIDVPERHEMLTRAQASLVPVDGATEVTAGLRATGRCPGENR